MVRGEGIEPPKAAQRKLPPHRNWSREEDSNLRPPTLKRRCSITELPRQKMVAVEGVEPLFNARPEGFATRRNMVDPERTRTVISRRLSITGNSVWGALSDEAFTDVPSASARPF